MGKSNNSIKKEFNSEPVYNKKKLKTKIKSYKQSFKSTMPMIILYLHLQPTLMTNILTNESQKIISKQKIPYPEN